MAHPTSSSARSGASRASGNMIQIQSCRKPNSLQHLEAQANTSSSLPCLHAMVVAQLPEAHQRGSCGGSSLEAFEPVSAEQPGWPKVRGTKEENSSPLHDGSLSREVVTIPPHLGTLKDLKPEQTVRMCWFSWVFFAPFSSVSPAPDEFRSYPMLGAPGNALKPPRTIGIQHAQVVSACGSAARLNGR